MYIVHDDEIHVINVNGEEHDQDVLLDYVGKWIKENVIKNIMKKRVKVYFVKDNDIYGVKIKQMEIINGENAPTQLMNLNKWVKTPKKDEQCKYSNENAY